MTFIERSRIGKTIYMLREDHLDISRDRFGDRGENRISLRQLSGECALGARRIHVWTLIGVVVACACIWLLGHMLSQTVIPMGAAIHVIGYILMTLVVFVGVAFNGVRRVEYWILYDLWKKPIITIVREKSQAEECDAFIAAILQRIEELDAGVVIDSKPADHRAQISSVSLPTGEASGVEAASGKWWLGSIVSGAMAVGYPILFSRIPEFSASVFYMSFGGSAVGIFLAVRSFQLQERLRFLSLLGIALSAVPIIF